MQMGFKCSNEIGQSVSRTYDDLMDVTQIYYVC